MKSIISRIFGDRSKKSTQEGAVAQRGEPVSYSGLIIRAAPERTGDQWRLAGVIIKQDGDRALERTYLRADTFSTREEAETFAVRKGKQIIDEQGARLFADGELSGRA